MEQGQLRVRVAVLCATVLLHVTVVAAFLQKVPLGARVLVYSHGHSSERPQSPQTVTVSLASLVGPKELHRRPSFGAAADVSLQSVPIEFDKMALILPNEDAADAVDAGTLLGSVEIRCEVHIHQSPQGQVQAFDFGACTGDAEWQRSLIRLIERAAELVQPTAGVLFPPVRTFTVATASLSPLLLARQLSSVDSAASEPEEVNLERPQTRSVANASSDP
jgi:hypothetical protein